MLKTQYVLFNKKYVEKIHLKEAVKNKEVNQIQCIQSYYLI